MRPADNPFRTERIDRLRYRLTGATPDDLAGQFAALGRRAAVIGDHGSGKSRLLATLADHLEARGLPSLRIRCGRDPLPSAQELAGRLLIADELDHLGRWRRRRLLARAARAGGVLAAVHRLPRDLPVLHHCAVDAGLVAELIRELTGAPPPPDLGALLRDHAGNVRALFRHLYDRAAATTANNWSQAGARRIRWDPRCACQRDAPGPAPHLLPSVAPHAPLDPGPAPVRRVRG